MSKPLLHKMPHVFVSWPTPRTLHTSDFLQMFDGNTVGPVRNRFWIWWELIKPPVVELFLHDPISYLNWGIPRRRARVVCMVPPTPRFPWAGEYLI
jgi:hypothetical protein